MDKLNGSKFLLQGVLPSLNEISMAVAKQDSAQQSCAQENALFFHVMPVQEDLPLTQT